MADQPKFRYFSPMPGCAVARYGTGAHIGATRTPTGFVIDPEAVVAIPESEVLMYSKEYVDAVRHSELRERKQEDFDAQQARVIEQEKREAAERQAAQTQPVELSPNTDSTSTKAEGRSEQGARSKK